MILCPVITSQQGLCYSYTKYKLEYTNHDCLYSSEWQSVRPPPGMNPGFVIDVHEDRVEEELRQSMNLQILLPDEKLIALVEAMIASLKSLKAESKC